MKRSLPPDIRCVSARCESVVEVDRLRKSFQEGPLVLKDVSFSVPRAGSLAIVGPSGCGKTTLLYMLSGLLSPSSGAVLVNDREAAKAPGRTGFILQDFGLLPWRTVWENICLGMKIQGVDKATRTAKAERILGELGLLSHRDRFPGGLSGGEKQRVAIGRALAVEPELLLMDEPFSALDAPTRETLQNTLAGIWIREGLTMILVTHSIEEAVFLGRSIMVMSGRPGSIKAILENKHAGDAGFRNEEAFYGAVKQVRKLLES